MKKIFLFIILFISILSCEDAIETVTDGQLEAENAFNTVNDLQQGLNTVYARYGVFSEYELNSVFTDEVGIGAANGGQGLTDGFFGFVLNSNSDAPNDIWATHYSVLNMANRVISAAELITPSSGDQALYNSIVGQAKAFRALSHLQLLSYFSTDIKNPESLGVIKLDFIPITTDLLLRNKNNDIYSLIESDIASAKQLLPNTNLPANNITIDTRAVLALEARYLTYVGKHQEAIQIIDQVLPQVSLASGTTYRNMFHTDDPGEVIFKLKRVLNQTRIGSVWASVNATVNGSAFYEVGRSLFNELVTTNQPSATNHTITAIASGGNLTVANHGLQVNDMFVPQQTFGNLVAGRPYFVHTVVNANTIRLSSLYSGTAITNFTTNSSLSIPAKANYGDIRYSTNVHDSSIIDINYATSADYTNTDRLIVRKHPGYTAVGNLNPDIKMFRVSELYLLKTECQIALGDLSGAATTLKQMRDARTNRPLPVEIFANSTQAYASLLRERRLEYCFEGMRYIDVKRLGNLANQGFVRDARDCEVNNACSLDPNDYRLTLPIPISEINANPGIASQQNPGYTN